MILDASISILAGLGLFFIGAKGLGANMAQLTGRSLREWLGRSTGSRFSGALLGILSGAVTQSTNVITVILMSLASADLITLARARPILAWANLGTTVLVLIAAVDIHLFVFAVIAAAGLCFYLNLDRSGRWRPMVSAALGLGLLFLGIELMRNGSHELKDVPAVQEVVQLSARWAVSALAVGAAAALVAQSSATVAIIAVALAAAGLLDLAGATAMVFGASLGSGIGTYLVAANISGTPRQLAIFQALVKVLGVALLLPLYFLERAFDLPLLAHGIAALSPLSGEQVALVYLACQLASVLGAAVVGRAVEPLLAQLSPPSDAESLARPRYLYPEAVGDPESALTLVEREQARAFGLLPLHLGMAEHLEGPAAALERGTVLPVATQLLNRIAEFLADLADSGAARELLDRVADRRLHNSLLLSLHETLAELSGLLEQPFAASALASLSDNLRQGLGALFLTADEAVRSLAEDDILMLRQLTGDRDSVVDGLRRRVMAVEQGLSESDHQLLYALTSIFERLVWMLRRYAALLAPRPADATEPALAADAKRSEALS